MKKDNGNNNTNNMGGNLNPDNQPYGNEIYAQDLAHDLTKATLDWVAKRKLFLTVHNKSSKDWIEIVEEATKLFTLAIAKATVAADEASGNIRGNGGDDTEGFF
jgi:hypothetical protein